MLISRRLAFEAVLLKLVGGRAEGVGLDDVGAGATYSAWTSRTRSGLLQIQFVVAAIDVDALGVEHRAHRAVEDVDAVGLEEFSEVFHSSSLRIANCPIADCQLAIGYEPI